MNLDKDTLELIQFEAAKKAKSAINMKISQPENEDFWQGQYQAFNEIFLMIENMLKIN